MPEEQLKTFAVQEVVDTLIDHYPTSDRDPLDLFVKIESKLGDHFLVDDKLSLADLILAHYYYDHWHATEDDGRFQAFIDANAKL